MDELNDNIKRLLRSVGKKEKSEQEGGSECGCIQDDRVPQHALKDEDGFAETATFAICGHKIPVHDDLDEYKFKYDLSKNEVNAIEHIWANKGDLFNGVKGISNSYNNKDLPFSLFRYILSSIPKIGYSRAGLLTQMLLGYMGCYDHEESISGNRMDVSSKAYNNFMRMMRDNANNSTYKKIWRNWLNFVGSEVMEESKEEQGTLIFETKGVSRSLKDNDGNIGRNKFWTVESNGLISNSDIIR